MHRIRMRSLLPTLARAVALLALALGPTLPATAGAQTGTTTGAIRGRIADETNNPVPAAQVTATNVETGLARSTQSDDEGVYTIRLLPPGTYRVSVRRLGSQPAQLDNIRVLLSQTAPANFVLRTASVTLSAVQVTAEAQVDVADAGVKTHVSQEEIENLPTLGRDFTDFINLSGAVSPTPEATTGGQFAIAGQRPSQTNIQIDGVDANNAYFGENRGGSRVPFTFSLESIREFQIVTNGYDVEYGNYSGGIVNIVTRGGTNEFKGTAYANYRDESLTSRNFNGTPVAEFTAAQYAASVEGPIIKDKLHYLVSIDGQQRNEPFSSWSPRSLRAEGFPSDSALADSLERFIDILETNYGVANAGSGFGEFTTTDDVITLFGRLDWSINDRHRLSLRNNFNSHKNANETFSGAIRGGRSTAETIRDKNNSFVGELTSEFGGTLFNTLRLQYATEARPRTPNDNLPSLRVNLTPSEQLTYGGNSIAFRNNLDEDKFQVVNNLTWLRGDHSLKIGTNNTFSFIQQTFWRNGTGVYTFGSLEDLEDFAPNAFERSIRADRATPGSKFDVQELSGYLQDDWQVTPKLLASLGVRYDVLRIGDRPGRVVDAERAFGIETGIAPEDNDNISPRVSFTYDLFGDATHVVRAGGGLFYGRIPYVLANNVAATDVPTSRSSAAARSRTTSACPTRTPRPTSRATPAGRGAAPTIPSPAAAAPASAASRSTRSGTATSRCPRRSRRTSATRRGGASGRRRSSTSPSPARAGCTRCATRTCATRSSCSSRRATGSCSSRATAASTRRAPRPRRTACATPTSPTSS
jgi:outer membrane receptor for ferrienterochelin and colicin